MDEGSLIPYRASELTGERVLALSAHPDDEILGAGGMLALNAGTAQEIRIWVATDGGAQEGADQETTTLYRQRRREESREAARTLGLAEPVFGDFVDRGLQGQRRDLDAALSALIEDFQPDLILCPSPVEIHPDHRALAEALYQRVAASRAEDADHDRYRHLRVAFYEISHPLLPNALVDISAVATRKASALQAFVSQQAVRDYAGALGGLNAYRRLTLGGTGPVEAFRVVGYPELSTRSLEQFRRSIGPAIVADGERGVAPVSVVVRTRNRPALLAEALESLRAQTMRPAEVVVVNDGGASVSQIAANLQDAFVIQVEEHSQSEGRSRAANRGIEAARSDLVCFLDDDDRLYPDHIEHLVRAFRAGPEPVVYSDAATVVYERKDDHWEERLRTLQYSLDYDPDYLLLANYIPLHTLLLPRSLYLKAGGFDEELDLSEDWDFLIRLSDQTAFRHLRAVTCEYRVFSESVGDPTHEAAGSPAFARARQEIYERYASRRTPEGLARVIDRLRAQIAFWVERDGISQGELRYHRRLHAGWERMRGELESARARLAAAEHSLRGLETERSRLLAENELVHARLAELFAANEQFHRLLAEARVEIDRLNAMLQEIFGSRTWKLHLFLDRIRGRR